MTFDEAVKEAQARGACVLVYKDGRLVGSFDPAAPGHVEAFRFRTSERDYFVSDMRPGESIAHYGSRSDGGDDVHVHPPLKPPGTEGA